MLTLSVCWPFMHEHNFAVLSFTIFSRFYFLCYSSALLPLLSFLPLNLSLSSSHLPDVDHYQQRFPFIFCSLNFAIQILWLLGGLHCKFFHSSFLSHNDSFHVLSLPFQLVILHLPHKHSSVKLCFYKADINLIHLFKKFLPFCICLFAVHNGFLLLWNHEIIFLLLRPSRIFFSYQCIWCVKNILNYTEKNKFPPPSK